jgi:hypothetical protein
MDDPMWEALFFGGTPGAKIQVAADAYAEAKGLPVASGEATPSAQPETEPAARRSRIEDDGFSVRKLRRMATETIRSLITGEEPSQTKKEKKEQKEERKEQKEERKEEKKAARQAAREAASADGENLDDSTLLNLVNHGLERLAAVVNPNIDRINAGLKRIQEATKSGVEATVPWLVEKDEKFRKEIGPWFARIEAASAHARERAGSPDNAGLLGRLGLLTEEEQKAWVAGERITADHSLAVRKKQLERANEAVEIFEKGVPAGTRLHPWIADRQKIARKDVQDAEARTARVGEIERGERAGAWKTAWRAAIEQGTTAGVRGAARLTTFAEAIGEFQAAVIEAAGGPPDRTNVWTDLIVKVGDLIGDKAAELFLGDPARQDEVVQVLAKRAGTMIGVAGSLKATAWVQHRRRAKKEAKRAAREAGE